MTQPSDTEAMLALWMIQGMICQVIVTEKAMRLALSDRVIFNYNFSGN